MIDDGRRWGSMPMRSNPAVDPVGDGLGQPLRHGCSTGSGGRDPRDDGDWRDMDAICHNYTGQPSPMMGGRAGSAMSSPH